MNSKKNLGDIELKERINETLEELYKNYGVDDNNRLEEKFNKIWNEKFVEHIDSSRGDFEKDDKGQYKNPIIRTIYDKFHHFYFKECFEIKKIINKIETDIDNILKKEEKK